MFKVFFCFKFCNNPPDSVILKIKENSFIVGRLKAIYLHRMLQLKMSDDSNYQSNRNQYHKIW